MKKMTRWFASLLAVCSVFFTLTTAAHAAGKPTPRPKPRIPYTAIASVDPAAMTITVEPKNSTATGTKTFKFTAQTKITVNGHDGTVADLTPGQQVHVGLGTSDTIADELTVTAPPADPK